MTSKNFLTIAAVVSMISNTSSFAQSWTQCRVYEFAEMTSMTTAELDKLYCDNVRTLNAAKNMSATSLDFASKFLANGGMRQYNEQKKNAEKYDEHTKACSVENERVVRALKKVNPKSDTPTCE